MSDRKLPTERGGPVWGGVARIVGGPFAKLAARVLIAAAGLALLAFIGHTAVAGAVSTSVSPGAPSASGMSAPTPAPATTQPATGGGSPIAGAAAPLTSAAPETPLPSSSTARASAENPVLLNTASEMDLRRLPGIGAKRAAAILELRARLGRFRAIEDLLKVKGIGRAMLKRLRPLVRIDAPSSDAGGSVPGS